MADCKCPNCNHEWEDKTLVTHAEFDESVAYFESKIDALVDSNAGSVILSFGEWPLPIKVEAENDASYMAFIQPLNAKGAA